MKEMTTPASSHPEAVPTASAVPARNRKTSATKTSVKARAAALPTFVEGEPIVLDSVRVKPVDSTAPTQTNAQGGQALDLDAKAQADAARRWAHLPDNGPGIIKVVPIGSRIILQPSDKQAAQALDFARIQLGFHWDAKQRRHINHLDGFTRRGVTQFDSLRLISAMFGLNFEVPEGVESVIRRYRSRLERQLRPIPRFTWSDDVDHTGQTVEAELDLGTSGYRRWNTATR